LKKQENDNQVRGTDLNGNGINDVFISDKYGNWWVYSMANQAGQLGAMTERASQSNTNIKGDIMPIDFNGDGKANIWCFDEGGVSIYAFTGSNLSFIDRFTSFTKDHHFTFGDFNGDGRIDLFVYGYKNTDWSNWQVQLSTGTGFETKAIPRKKLNLKDDYVRMGDFNGDGITDLMVSSSNQSWTGTYFYITKNEGSDFYTNSLPGYPSSSHNYFVADFYGDGRTDFLCTDGESDWWNGYQMYRSGTKNKMMLEKVADGLNSVTKINYKCISEPGAPYIKGTGAAFPVFDFQGAIPVVSSVISDNGRGSQNTTNYSYEGMKMHRQGKGFIGTTKQIVTDVATNFRVESLYSYNPINFTPLLTQTIKKHSTDTLSHESNTWTTKITATGVIFPYINSSTQTNNITGHSITQTFDYDNYGNPTDVETNYNNDVTETTTNVFNNNTTNWWLGRLTSTTVAYSKSGEPTISNTVTSTYSSDGILKPDIIKYNEGTNLYYYKNHDYNSNGNLTQLYEWGTGVGARQTNYTWEENGIRVKTINDPLGHVTTNNYDSYGRLYSVVDYLENTTSYTYDNFGRMATETSPDGFITNFTYNWGLTGGPTYSCFNVLQTGNDGSSSRTWYDKLSREIRNDVKGLNGTMIYTAIDYNTKGQLYRVSEPSFSTSTPDWNTYSYDSYGRNTGISRPSGRNTTYAYGPNSRITETTAGNSSWKETNSQGLVTKANDNGGLIEYDYFPDGKLRSITAPDTAPGSVVTTMEYNDAARNQTKLIDPSAGTIEYTYNSYGQIRTQKNARNQVTTYTYHADGRIITKVTPEGTTTYSYCPTNKQLTGISSPNVVSRTIEYDGIGRVYSISESIQMSLFTTSFTYDNLGRLSTRTHPSMIVEEMIYDSNSGLLKIIKADGANRYELQGTNAHGQVTQAKLSSINLLTLYEYEHGYLKHTKARLGSSTWRQDYQYEFNTVTGNLNWRKNHLRNLTETFTYDNLDRLHTVTGPQNLTMGYDTKGNITQKSDVGNTFDYTHPTKPYALTGIETSTGLIPDIVQTVNYTSFEQPSSIVELPFHAQFVYNSDGQRARMMVFNNDPQILSRWYVGSRYMKETAGSTTKEYTWIGGDAYTAPCLAIKTSSQTLWYSLLRDHLGNITHMIQPNGSVSNEYSYDAWGRRRNFTNWGYSVASQNDLLPDRGFTSHEWLPWFNLYNMNGRLYDPVVGRFLSPDNYVQAPDFTQSFNRYSYCWNNPLKYTDHSGEWFGVDDAVVAGLGFVVGYVSYGITSGNWGKDALVSGGITAGASWLVYNTAGAASGLLVKAGFGNGAATVIGNGIGGATGSFAGNVAGQAYFTGNVDLGKSFKSALYGFGFGVGSGLVDISPIFGKKFFMHHTAKYILRSTAGELSGNLLCGGYGSMTYGLNPGIALPFMSDLVSLTSPYWTSKIAQRKFNSFLEDSNESGFGIKSDMKLKSQLDYGFNSEGSGHWIAGSNEGDFIFHEVGVTARLEVISGGFSIDKIGFCYPKRIGFQFIWLEIRYSCLSTSLHP
jgi:RHS repeat-associated protein